MYSDKRILAIIPARGGSKGIKLKNLVKINGKSLIEHAADVVHQTSMIDQAVVSTDHLEIKAEAERHNLAVPFLRPDKLSGDRIGDIEVLQDATGASEETFSCRFDVVLMLQPTSPLRRPEHIELCIKTLYDYHLDCVWTVSETDSKAHPLKQLLVEDGKITYYDERGRDIVARQMLSSVYHRNGLCYAFERDYLLSARDLLSKNNRAIVIKENCISIDTESDIKLAELFYQNHLTKRS